MCGGQGDFHVKVLCSVFKCVLTKLGKVGDGPDAAECNKDNESLGFLVMARTRHDSRFTVKQFVNEFPLGTRHAQ